MAVYNINGGEDYEKIESACGLDPSVYDNQSLGYISLRSSLYPDGVLAVAYEYSYEGNVYQVGEFSTDGITAPNCTRAQTAEKYHTIAAVENLGSDDEKMCTPSEPCRCQKDFELNVMYQNDSVGTMLQYLTEGEIANKRLLTVMNLDRLDKRMNLIPMVISTS